MTKEELQKKFDDLTNDYQELEQINENLTSKNQELNNQLLGFEDFKQDYQKEKSNYQQKIDDLTKTNAKLSLMIDVGKPQPNDNDLFKGFGKC